MPAPSHGAAGGTRPPNLDQLLGAAGWQVCDPQAAHITAHRGVAIRKFPLKSGHGFAGYLLYVDGMDAGVIDAKKEGAALSGVEFQSDKYTRRRIRYLAIN